MTVLSTTSVSLNSDLDSFNVANARAVAFLPQGAAGNPTAYAFVLGYNVPDENAPSHNHFVASDSPYEAGSNIGIITDVFGSPQIVAATLPIPRGLPAGSWLTPGRPVPAAVTYPTVTDEATEQEGAVFVYSVQAIVQAINGAANPSLLHFGP